ncbi:MAG: AarF/ABC1/UbiB kinase family protein [Armatimonadetes bacterium]|jgi:ubiquinone biosynthesis protein|nr:AarF/ABC1/UbiB kinase family protein [Armatimonadota bacterium]
MRLLRRRWRHVARVTQVAGVIVRYLGYEAADRLGLRHLVPRGIRAPNTVTDPASKLRATIEELGPTFVKLGQLLSTRPDLVTNPRYMEELVKLQDTAPPIPFEKVRHVVEEELQRPLEEAFQFFSAHPLAAASLGQAHTAILPDGTAVVVKVQRPGIRRVIETDLENLQDYARLATARFEWARVLNLVDLVEEFQLTLREELDYTREGRNMDRLRENLKSERRICVPTVHWHLTTARVLTQERIRGTKITEVETLRAKGIDPQELAQALGDAFMRQFFVDGFFHADPHPGNLIVTDEGIIALLDSGMVSRVDESTRSSVTRLLLSFVEQNSRLFAEEVLELGRALRPIDRKEFATDIDRMLRHYYDMPARDVNLGQIFNETLRLAAHHRLQLPGNFGLLVKVFANIDGITKRLDPDYNYLETARRFLGRVLAEQFQWESVSLDLFRAFEDARRLLLGLPAHSDRVLTKLAEGDLRVQLEHQGLPDLTRHLDRIGNRIAYSLVVAALILGSALFALAGVPPEIRGYPVIALAAFGVAVVMGIWLLAAILRSGSLR